MRSRSNRISRRSRRNNNRRPSLKDKLSRKPISSNTSSPSSNSKPGGSRISSDKSVSSGTTLRNSSNSKPKDNRISNGKSVNRRDNSAKQQQQQARGQQNQQRQERQHNDDRSAQQRSPEHVRQQQVAWQGDRAHSWESEHRTWQQRGGYHGYRVPDYRFRGYYGQDHGFRIYSLPVRYVGGHRRFQYGGYWFGLVDPWPEYWSSDWYDNDDVYVDYYGDGYYLYNRRYPGDRIAISFYLN